MKLSVHLTIVFILVAQVAGFSGSIVTEPVIKVFEPSGLKIGVGASEAVESIVFYVNINEDLDENDERKYKECVAKKSNEGTWSFEEDDMRLELGDVIHYKVNVRGYGNKYIYSGGPFVVNEILPRFEDTNCKETTASIDPPTPSTPSPSFEQESSSSQTLSLECLQSLNTVLRALADAQKELDGLRKEVEVLRDVAAKEPFLLRLSGLITATGEPKDVVQFVLFEKLNSGIAVRDAVRNGTTITFEVGSFEDKLDLLKRAKVHLKDSQNILITA